jgi:signal transduction histidine kinase
VPFLFNILFTLVSHGVGSAFQRTLIFNHPDAQADPWLWSFIHAVGVLIASVGMLLFWKITEESQQEKDALARRLAQTEIGRRQFTSDLLVNLARRNQGMLYRQLDIINQLEESERDPDALAELFKLDHLATRIRRNAESLLVLSGEQPTRTWSEPVPLRDVLRAAVAETEDLERVVIAVDEHLAVSGHTVTDLTHLVAELAENAVRYSPPDTSVTIRTRPDRTTPGGQVLTVEDWGVGMPPDDLAAANELLSEPPEVDLSVSQRLGFHVVARLAARHDIRVSLTPTPGSGVTAVVVLPPEMFATTPATFAGALPTRQPAQHVLVPDRAAWTGPTRSAPDVRRTGHRANGHANGHGPAVVPAPRPSTGALARAVIDGQMPPRPEAAAAASAGHGFGPDWSGWWAGPAAERGAAGRGPERAAPPPAQPSPPPRPDPGASGARPRAPCASASRRRTSCPSCASRPPARRAQPVPTRDPRTPPRPPPRCRGTRRAARRPRPRPRTATTGRGGGRDRDIARLARGRVRPAHPWRGAGRRRLGRRAAARDDARDARRAGRPALRGRVRAGEPRPRHRPPARFRTGQPDDPRTGRGLPVRHRDQPGRHSRRARRAAL